MAVAVPISEQLKQLNDARKLALSDSNYYPAITQGILPIIGPNAVIELRRWGADFLAEAFASPGFSTAPKESLALVVLDTLQLMIENVQQDTAVLKSLVQVAASIYPLLFRYIINNDWDKGQWEKMIAIKTRILRIWDTAAVGIRICCIKFAQRVVLVQTAGPAADPKRAEPLEVSVSIVPPNHPILLKPNLEAEASGLLDRILGVFQESLSNAVLIDATLNSLSLLIRIRPQIANKILNVILNFNPLKQANSPMTPKLRVMVKSMEKTTRSLLTHVFKRDPQHPFAPRIQQYIERMLRSKTEIFDEASRKRGPPEPTDGLDAAKRQKLGAQVKVPSSAPLIHIPPLTPGPHTIGELFTVTTDTTLKNFDVGILPEDMVLKLCINVLKKVPPDTLSQAIEGVRNRYDSFTAPPIEDVKLLSPALDVEEDEDDYDPDFYTAEDTEQILNKLDSAPPEEPVVKENVPDMALKSFTLPPPPPLTSDQAIQIGQNTVSRVFGVMQTLQEPGRKAKSGINRLAASAYDRDAWITIITRLATRTTAGLGNGVKFEENLAISMSNTIREFLYRYVLEDFRKNIDIAVAWLSEEWYNDKVQQLEGQNVVLQYDVWAMKILEGFVPYIDKGDKVLTRFLGEIPALNAEMLEKVKGLCRDPSLVTLAVTALLYLIMMRPPVREMSLDALEDIWRTYDDAKPMAAKQLHKWRPGWQEKYAEEEEKNVNGDAEAKAVAV